MTTDPASDAGTGPRDSGVRVVRGTPDETELVALMAGLVAMRPDEEEPGAPTSAWMDRARTMRGVTGRGPLGRGADAWRHSLR